MAITAYLYDADGHDRQVELTDETLGALEQQQLLWIDVDCRDERELREIAAKLKLDGSTVQSLVEPHGPTIDNYGVYAQFAVETAPAANGEQAGNNPGRAGNHRSGTRLDFVLSADWLLTVHDKVPGFVEAFRSQGAAETTIGALTPQAFTASLLDAHLEEFFEEVARIEAMVDRLDEQALTRPASKSLLGRMVRLRRRVSRLRTLLSSQRRVFYGLSRPDLQLISESPASSNFQVLAGRFERAIDEIEHARDLVVGSFELFATRTAQQTNELVRVLTYLTAVVGVCGAVAGILGMNFETGVFAAGDAGFYATVGFLLLFLIAASAIARWRGWI